MRDAATAVIIVPIRILIILGIMMMLMMLLMLLTITALHSRNYPSLTLSPCPGCVVLDFGFLEGCTLVTISLLSTMTVLT